MTETNEAVIAQLERVLATSYTLYLKTHNFHWNVTGPMFSSLHTLFETQYTELATAVDEIAERIRALGAKAPGSYSDFQRLSLIREETGHPAAQEMIRMLAADQQTIVALARDLFDAADEIDDQATADLATRRLNVHEKHAWMLRSHLE
ncbi:MAG: Dps family protein [Vicinamibacterales bacterium]